MSTVEYRERERAPREQREKLPEKKGTIQVFFSSEVRKDRDGKVMRNDRGYVMRGYFGYIHDDTEYKECDAVACREVSHQAKFKAEVLLKAIHSGAVLRGDKGEKVKFASRQQRSEREGPRPIVIFMRSAETRERPSKMIDEKVRYSR